MSDIVTLARTARESLARGLNALQGDPTVPPPLLELAAPIAQAMGALHHIEQSGGAQVAPNAQHALANLQRVLAQLQAQPALHAVVLTTAEAVAAALGTVHTLTRAAQSQAAPSAPHASASYAQQQAAPAAPHAYAPPQAPRVPGPVAYAPPQAPVGPGPVAHPSPNAPSRAAPVAQPRAAQARPASPPDPGPALHAGDLQAVPAELGAHSPTNFYKGLSGNDIVDHGGLFVATYKLPNLGHPVRLRVSLPGGYEFEANAVVRWRREPSDSGSDAPPGFGAQFTEITSEARQLIYRYVRNREPMFHDDL